MPEINFGLLQPVDVGALTQQGFSTGMAMVKHVQTKNALRSYLDNPDDPQAYNALAAYDPSAAATLQNQQLVRRKLQLDQQDRERAVALGSLATTNPRGAQQEALAAGDFDLASKFQELDEKDRQKLAGFYKAAGPIAYKLRQIADPEQRKALLAQARPVLEATGVDPKAIDSFDVTNNTALDGLIAANSTVDQLIERGKIQWHQQGEQPSFATDYMGRPVGTQNPYRQGGPTPGVTTTRTADSNTSRGIRNNNPLNLTESEFTRAQPGFAGTDSGGRYARFDSPEAGMAAGQHLLVSYLQRGFDTPAEIIERWAPAKENGSATANYVSYVAKRLGIGAHDPVTAEQVPALMQAMAEFENGGRSGGHKRAMSVGAAPHVATKKEYDDLPSGTPFVAPDGSHRVKP
jgi:hypothetical protein